MIPCFCREDLQFLPNASRQVDMGDFRKVLETFRPSGQHSQEYRQEQANTGQACLRMRIPSSPARNVTTAFASCCMAGAAPGLLRAGAAFPGVQAGAGQRRAAMYPQSHHYSSPTRNTFAILFCCSFSESTGRRRPIPCASISAQSILDSRITHMLPLVSWRSAICIVCGHRACSSP